MMATAIGHAFPLQRASASCGRRCRNATVDATIFFLRRTQVAQYFERTHVPVTDGVRSPLVVCAARRRGTSPRRSSVLIPAVPPKTFTSVRR
jgi:hypothetical protein